jgi:hypothetical protein
VEGLLIVEIRYSDTTNVYNTKSFRCQTLRHPSVGSTDRGEGGRCRWS